MWLSPFRIALTTKPSPDGGSAESLVADETTPTVAHRGSLTRGTSASPPNREKNRKPNRRTKAARKRVLRGGVSPPPHALRNASSGRLRLVLLLAASECRNRQGKLAEGFTQRGLRHSARRKRRRRRHGAIWEVGFAKTNRLSVFMFLFFDRIDRIIRILGVAPSC